jgi:effector-binding domain-containing protein
MMSIFTARNDTDFRYKAAVPVKKEPANPPKGDIALGRSPAGKMYKFVHRGPYEQANTTYEAIANFFDSKNLEAADPFIEEYVTDPVKTPQAELVFNVYVPVK